jgi:hypothetical protein
MMTTSYTVDAEDRITEVGAEWDRFAVENDGAAACAAFVVGQPLFQSIEGDPARMFMQAIFQRVRVGGDSASLRYRCDAPRARRHFLMTVTALPEKALRIDHELEREEIMARRVDFRMAAWRDSDSALQRLLPSGVERRLGRPVRGGAGQRQPGRPHGLSGLQDPQLQTTSAGCAARHPYRRRIAPPPAAGAHRRVSSGSARA